MATHPSAPIELGSRVRALATSLWAVGGWPAAVLLLASAVNGAASLGAPMLARWPLVLALLAPRTPFLLLAAPHCSLLGFVALVSLRQLSLHPVQYLLGLRLGTPSSASRFEDVAARIGPTVLAVRAGGPMVRLAGALAWPRRQVALFDALGTVVGAVAVHRASAAVVAPSWTAWASSASALLLTGTLVRRRLRAAPDPPLPGPEEVP